MQPWRKIKYVGGQAAQKSYKCFFVIVSVKSTEEVIGDAQRNEEFGRIKDFRVQLVIFTNIFAPLNSCISTE